MVAIARSTCCGARGSRSTVISALVGSKVARAPEPGVKKGERKAPVLKKRRADKTEWKRFQYALGKVPEAKERYSMLKSRSLQIQFRKAWVEAGDSHQAITARACVSIIHVFGGRGARVGWLHLTCSTNSQRQASRDKTYVPCIAIIHVRDGSRNCNRTLGVGHELIIVHACMVACWACERAWRSPCELQVVASVISHRGRQQSPIEIA
jgi:hypothetical protein